MTKSPLICNVRQPKVLRHLICVPRPNQTQSITQPLFNPFKKAIQEKEEGEMMRIQYLDAAFAGLAGDEDRAESRLLDGDGNLDAEPSSCSGCGATARRSACACLLLAAPSIASSSSATAFLSSAGVVLLPREAQQAGDPSKEPHRIHPRVHPALEEREIEIEATILYGLMNCNGSKPEHPDPIQAGSSAAVSLGRLMDLLCQDPNPKNRIGFNTQIFGCPSASVLDRLCTQGSDPKQA